MIGYHPTVLNQDLAFYVISDDIRSSDGTRSSDSATSKSLSSEGMSDDVTSSTSFDRLKALQQNASSVYQLITYRPIKASVDFLVCHVRASVQNTVLLKSVRRLFQGLSSCNI